LKAQITWLVGNMHVWTSYLDVARDIYLRCRKAGLSRSKRKQAIKWALEAHRHNREIVREFRL
jgi:hypothetical protein